MAAFVDCARLRLLAAAWFGVGMNGFERAHQSCSVFLTHDRRHPHRQVYFLCGVVGRKFSRVRRQRGEQTEGRVAVLGWRPWRQPTERGRRRGGGGVGGWGGWEA